MADMATWHLFYSTLQVVSKKKLDMASQEEYHERLSQKFDKIERERRSKEEEAAASSAPAQSDDDAALGGRILLVTHVNTFLYAACFFIQVGTLPVRFNESTKDLSLCDKMGVYIGALNIQLVLCLLHL